VPTYFSSEEDKTLLILFGSDEDIFIYMLVIRNRESFGQRSERNVGQDLVALFNAHVQKVLTK